MSEQPQGKIIDNHVLLDGNDAITVYNRGYYGIPESDGIRLTGFETLHLMELNRITITDQHGVLSAYEVMKYFTLIMDNFMARYLVYKDLRNRGYIVNQGSGSSFFFRMYQRGDVPKKDSASYYISPLQEGTSINLQELDDLVKLADRSKKELVFGLVDATGDVSYLKVNQLYPESLPGREFSDFENWDWDAVWQDYLTWD